MNLDQFRARPLVVTVKELCPCCNVLKEGVKKREYPKQVLGVGYFYTYCGDCAVSLVYTDSEDYYAW